MTASDTVPIGRLILFRYQHQASFSLAMIRKSREYQKHHRHPRDCVSAPPTIGAAMMASDSTHAINPANTGRLLSGRIWARTAKQPASSPANPRFVTALPTINIVDEAAVAQSTEPTRNITLLVIKTILIEKSVYSFANPNWNAQVQSRNAEEYHPTSARVWKWLVMLGTAVATMLASRPPRIRITHSAITVNQNLVPVG